MFSAALGSAVFSDISGRAVFVRILCDTQTSGKIQLFINNANAGEYAITAPQISLLAAGYVGGCWNDFTNNSSSQFMLDGMSFSESS